MYMHTHTHMYMHAHMHTHMYMHMHTHMHTHMMCTRKSEWDGMGWDGMMSPQM